MWTLAAYFWRNVIFIYLFVVYRLHILCYITISVKVEKVEYACEGVGKGEEADLVAIRIYVCNEPIICITLYNYVARSGLGEILAREGDSV